jgi:protein gp37
MQKTKIDWPTKDGQQLYTWNPITGCKRGCSYCYARRIHERFNKTPYSDIVLHPERLNDPIKHKKPCTIFVGSMSDCCYWKQSDFLKVLEICRKCPQHTFMFLTKGNYNNMPIYANIPLNAMLGYTMTSGKTPFSFIAKSFLSIEPLLGCVKYDINYHDYELVIPGAMTGANAVIPKPEWIESVRQRVPAEKLYWKSSMKPFIGYSGWENNHA